MGRFHRHKTFTIFAVGLRNNHCNTARVRARQPRGQHQQTFYPVNNFSVNIFNRENFVSCGYNIDHYNLGSRTMGVQNKQTQVTKTVFMFCIIQSCFSYMNMNHNILHYHDHHHKY